MMPTLATEMQSSRCVKRTQSPSQSVKSQCVCDDDAKICVQSINFPCPLNKLAGKASDFRLNESQLTYVNIQTLDFRYFT